MNWKGIVLTITTVLVSASSFAQANLLNAEFPEEVGVKTVDQIEADNDEPLPYGYVDDRDILWSKTVWERIDLDERINFPYYYPIDTVDIGSERRSLYDVIIKNIKNNFISIYLDTN